MKFDQDYACLFSTRYDKLKTNFRFAFDVFIGLFFPQQTDLSAVESLQRCVKLLVTYIKYLSNSFKGWQMLGKEMKLP